MSKHGVQLLPNPDGGFRIVYDDTPYGRALERKYVATGEKLRQTYVAKYDDGHNRQFFKDKKIDWYARIQSFKDQCLIENIIKRCTGGDMSALQQVQGMYGDFSHLPTDPRATYDLINQAKDLFESLPDEVKQRDFAGSFENMLGTFGDNQALDRYLRERVKKPVKEASEDVKE